MIINILLISIQIIAQGIATRTNDIKPEISQRQDSIVSIEHNRILTKLAKVLNRSCPQCKWNYDPKGCYIKDGKPFDFFVFDLTDTLNRSFVKTRPYERFIEFKENHVYHFAPTHYAHSFSHILIIRNAKLVIFRSLNCPRKGDDLQNVFKYMDKIGLSDLQMRNNVANYRKFGIYFAMDPETSLRCDKSEDRKLRREVRKYKRKGHF